MLCKLHIIISKTVLRTLPVASTNISLGCANGEVAPFVGHNAFLRWSAGHDAAFIDPADSNKRKQWSEANVSEDFDLVLKLLLHRYILRWATYSLRGCVFDDELVYVDFLFCVRRMQ
jgi:glycosyl transferase family 2